jgi:hypothetical protein
VRKGTTFETKAERTIWQINSRWPGNPVSESGLPPDHCWERGLPPYISDCWLELPLEEMRFLGTQLALRSPRTPFPANGGAFTAGLI